MLDRFEIMASRLRRRLSRSLLTGRFLGRGAPDEHSDAAGLILVQVDGLSEIVLRRALREGHMPFVKRLIERDGHRIYPLYSGLPSNTPGFQAEFFYGSACAVPAFCYRDAESGRTLALNLPAAAATVERRLRKGHRGLFRGGSSWSNIFTGGASEPHLCASTVGLRTALGGLAPRRIFTLVVLHGWSVVRVLANMVAVSALAFWDLVRGRLPLRDIIRELQFVPLRVAVSVAMREIVAAGASVDAGRGLPIIQLNFLGYDEHAHRRGPESGFARWSLRGIDRSIQRVWMAAHRSHRRDYEMWIYSDHGQEAVTPFSVRHGAAVPDVVRRIYNEVLGTAPDEVTIRAAQPGFPTLDRARWLGSRHVEDWLEAAERRDRHHAGSVGSADADGTSSNGGGADPESAAPPASVAARGSFEITHQGPLGCVYLPREHDAAFLHRFASRLAILGRLPIVVVRGESGRATAFTESGVFELPDEAAAVLGATHPHLHEVARDIVRVAHHSGAGDAVLMGYRPGDPLSLQHEHGSHGGPGANETSAFVILPPEATAYSPLQSKLRPLSLRRMVQRVLREAEVGATEGARYAGPSIRGTEATVEMRLRIMTYNVHGCRGVDGVYSPHRIARVIARERPDVVCLQELDEGIERSGSVNQVERIARRLRVEYQFHAVSEVGGGRFGNAVLSLIPIHRIAAGPLPKLTGMQALNLWDRGVLWVALEMEGHRIHLLNTHLSVFPRERGLQIEALMSDHWLGHPDLTGPIVLAGDLNASPRSRHVTTLETRLRNVVTSGADPRALRTWSGRVPLRRIDHIFVNAATSVERVYVPRTRLSRVASDHLPLVADLVVRVPRGEPRDGQGVDSIERASTDTSR